MASVLLECFEVLQCIVMGVCGQTVCELVTLAAEVRSSMAMLCELEGSGRTASKAVDQSGSLLHALRVG